MQNGLNNLLIVCARTVDGGWSTWGDWGKCSLTCGTGSRSRRRRCDTPVPQHGGSTCPGTVLQNGLCVLDACPGTGTSVST